MTTTKLNAAALMTTDLVTVAPDSSLREAMELMQEAHVGSLPVVDEQDRCIGVISVRDILNSELEQVETEDTTRSRTMGSFYDPDTDAWRSVAIVGSIDDLPDREVREVMSDQVIFVHPNAPITDVAEAMVSQGIHHVLVMDSERRLHGIISSLDFVKLSLQTLE